MWTMEKLFIKPWHHFSHTTSKTVASFQMCEGWCLFLATSIAVIQFIWSQWPRDLRHEPSSPARTLGSWVLIPLKAWIFVYEFILCVGSSLATGWSPVQGVLPTVYKIKKLKRRSSSTRAVAPQTDRQVGRQIDFLTNNSFIYKLLKFTLK
jgi:hypothetical protein